MAPNAALAAARNSDRHRWKLKALGSSTRLSNLRAAQDQNIPGRQTNIERAYSSMHKEFDLCEEAHVAFLLASGITPGEAAAEDDWLETVRTTILGHDPPVVAADLQAATRRRRAAKFAVEQLSAEIVPRVDALNEGCLVAAELTQEAIKLWLQEAADIRVLLNTKYIPATQTHLEHVLDADYDACSTAYTAAITEWRQALSQANLTLRTAVQEPQVAQPQVVVPPGGPAAAAAALVAPAPVAGQAPPRRGGPKLAPTVLTFSGRPRDYLTFKRTAQELLGDEMGPFGQYTHLWGALPDTVRQECTNYTQDPKALWEQLDRLFQHPTVQVDAAVTDIGEVIADATLTAEGRMKRLALVYEGVVEGLREAGLEAELKADLFIQRLVSMLPPEEVKAFSQRVSQGTIAGASDFERFSKFLRARAEEIRLAERMLGSNNPSQSIAALSSFGMVAAPKPGSISAPGPATASCNTGQPAQVPGRNYPEQRKVTKCLNCGGDHDLHRDGCDKPLQKCDKCRNWGHLAVNCKAAARDRKGRQPRNRDSNATRRQSRSRSRSRSSSAPPGGHQNHAGEVTGGCRRCTSAKNNPDPCGGCRKQQPDHCLRHCERFLMADCSGRVGMAKAAKACPHCLGLNHTFQDCKTKEKSERGKHCGIGGCRKLHHRTLHGSNDPYVTRECNHTAPVFIQGAFRKVGAAPHAPIIFPVHATEEMASAEREAQLEEMRQFALSPEEPPPTVIMVMMTVQVQYGPRASTTTVTLFADSGSTCTIVTNRCARRLGLHGRPVIVYMRTVNGERKLETHLFIVELLDARGKRCVVYALGMDDITSDVQEIEMEGVRHLFNGEARRRWKELKDRPVGPVDILLGSDYAGYHATRVIQAVDHMILAESVLSSKMVAQGTHPTINVHQCTWNPDVLALRTAVVTNHVRTGSAPITAPLRVFADYVVADELELSCLSTEQLPCPGLGLGQPDGLTGIVGSDGLPTPQRASGPSHLQHFLHSAHAQLNSNITEAEFLAGEQLGVEAPRRCARCRGCQECSARGVRISEREEAELALMRECVSFDHDTKEFNVKFPWLKDPTLLTDNYGQARKIAQGWEQKYADRGLTELANLTFSTMIEQGMVRPISKEECSRWSGPCHYVAVQGVESGSVSTPLRLVTNTSLKGSNGLSPNDCLAKGPDLLQDPFDVWIRFRVYEQVLLSDVSKAYHRLRTGLVELHTRRVLWRFSPDEEWQIFGLLCLSFGDRPAAALLEIVLEMCADLFGQIDTEAAWRVVKDRFVDDLHTGGDPQQVQRFVGEEKEDGSFSGTIPRIFESGGLRLKAVVRSGEPDGERLAKLGSSLMGHSISTERDELGVKVELNFTKKKGRAPSGPSINPAECVQQLAEVQFTRRLALSAVSGIYDPYGYLAPLTVKLRSAVRDLFDPDLGLGWDSPLPPTLQDWWRAELAELVSLQVVHFPRCVRRPGLRKLTLVVFFDASKAAVAAVVYCVWETPSGHHTALLCAKTKLAPAGMLSVPRLELIAALLASRLGRRVVLALSTTEFRVERCLWAGDSETVLAALTKSKSHFSDFFSNRITEVRENAAEVAKLTETEEWYHVPGIHNPADRPSRLDSQVEHIAKDSEWFRGPAFLSQPRHTWPFNRDYLERRHEPEFPAEELNKRGIKQLVESNTVLLSDIPDLISERANLLVQQQLGECDAQLDHRDSVAVVMANCLDSQPACDWTHLGCRGLAHFATHASRTSDEDPVQAWLGHGQLTNCWEKLLRLTGLLLRWLAPRRELLALGQPDGLTGVVGGDGPPTPQPASGRQLTTRERSIRYWIRQAMPSTYAAYKAGRLAALTLFEEDGMLRVRGRAGAGLEAAFQQESLPVILAETRVAYLITLWAHDQQHTGRDLTAHLARAVAWIVGGTKLAGRIAASCVRCMFLNHRLEGQQMAPLPAALQVPAPPWTYIGLDYAGPFTCAKGRRTRSNPGTVKVWALVIACLGTKAVSIRLVQGYGTEDLLTTLQIHIADCGRPLWVHTDRGSQLVKAGKAVNEDAPQWDFTKLAELGKGATQWSACPAGAQFRNGALEATVKRLKRSLAATYGKQILSVPELELAFRKVSSLVNSRPVYAYSKPGAGEGSEFLEQLTPNHLLLGRSGPDAVHPQWDMLAGPHARLSYVSDLTQAWWRQWTVHNLADLVPTRAWRTEQRAVQPGDIVLVEYDSKVKTNYKLARVVLQEISVSDGLVRTVVVRYSIPLPGASDLSAALPRPKYLRVPVQRLAVIVAAESQDPAPQVSTKEAEAARKAVGPLQPSPPPPAPALPPAPCPPAPQCLLDLFRLPPPVPAPLPVPPPARVQQAKPAGRAKRRNPRLPDPSAQPARTRAAARAAHHLDSLCTSTWASRFSQCSALSARLPQAYLESDLDHAVQMEGWLWHKGWQQKH